MKLGVVIALCLAMTSLGGCNQIGLTSAVIAADLNKPRDPVSVALRDGGSWNITVPLTPAPFRAGQSRTEVEALLAKSGYSREERAFHPRAVPARAEVYSRRENGPVCSILREVYVVFTSNDVLTDASGASFEAGCL